MPHVIRWGQSAYETDADLAREREAAEALGYTWAAAPDAGQPPEGLDAADVLVVTSRTVVGEDLLERFGGDLVHTTTSGFDHVDVAAARRRGVTVSRSPLARRDAVVDHAVGAMIALMRRFPPLLQAASDGRWARGDLPGLAPRGVAGATVVVVGLGVIGARAVEVLEALGASVRGVDPQAAPDGWTLDEALDGADAVTLHCALTETSRGLLDRARLDRLPGHAVVVNTARGEVLDVAAAVEAVRDGRLAGLAVDVFPTEPHPALAEHAIPGVWLTPHAAGYRADLGRRVAGEVAEALGAHADGRSPAHVVSAA